MTQGRNIRVEKTAEIYGEDGGTIYVDLRVYYPPTPGSPFAAMRLVEDAARQATDELLDHIIKGG